MEAKAKAIIKEWYERIGFPNRCDAEFYRALDNYEIDSQMKAENYEDKGDGVENFLYYLFFCDDLRQRYQKKGISEEIMRDTVSDMPVWLDIWSGLKGGLYLGELDWFVHHFTMRLFKLGRLQYCFSQAYRDVEEFGICKGDRVIDIHIPALGPLYVEECIESLEMARWFFAKYYPEYKYKHLTCHSWLLGQDLTSLLKEDSNILKFQKLFYPVEQYESDAILNYTLRWQIKRDEIGSVEAVTSLAKTVKRLALEGRIFHGGYGIAK